MTRIAIVFAVSLLLCTGAALAGLDPGPDQIGVYFDAGATTIEMGAVPITPFDVFVVLTNPSRVDFQGFELGYEITCDQSKLLRLSETFPTVWIDVGLARDHYLDSITGSMAEPMWTQANTILVHWTWMITTAGTTATFEVGNPHWEGGQAAYLDGDGNVIPMAQAPTCAGPGRALLNMYCGVDVEDTSFGTIKALFR